MKNLVLNEIFKILSRKVVLERPKDKSLAHYASPEAFALAKELRKAPKLIAEELAAKFKDSEILSATAVNGYLNFHLKPAVLGILAENALSLNWAAILRKTTRNSEPEFYRLRKRFA